MSRPSQQEIDQVINWAAQAEATGSSSFPGMSYEEGVRAAIEWMQGNGERPDDE